MFIRDPNEQHKKESEGRISRPNQQVWEWGNADATSFFRSLAEDSLRTRAIPQGKALAVILEDSPTQSASFLDKVKGLFGVKTEKTEEITVQPRYKCRILSESICEVFSEPESKDDNTISVMPYPKFLLPKDTTVSSEQLQAGTTVVVNIDNRYAVFTGEVAGSIISIVEEGTDLNNFSSNCDFNIPKSGGFSKTELLKECGITSSGGGGRSVNIASAEPPRPTGDNTVSPISPITGKRTNAQNPPNLGDIGTINSGFPKRNVGGGPHKGLDLRTAGSDGTPTTGVSIRAALDGVAMLGQDSRDPELNGYGYYVVVKHTAYKTTTKDNTFYTLYAHLEKDGRKTGKVSAGDEIAKSGDSGGNGKVKTPPHLHFEVIYEHNPAWKKANQVTQGGATDPIKNFFQNQFEKL